MIKILGIPSCIHKQASSIQLLNMMKAVGDRDWVLEVADLSNLPLFNRDIGDSMSLQKGEVDNFRNLVMEANALVFCASEFPLGYAYSVTAPLKNAIDWAVFEPNLFESKPAAFLAVDGVQDTGINCYHLRQLSILCGINCFDKYQFTLTPQECDPQTGFVIEEKIESVKTEVGKVFRALAHECRSETKIRPGKQHFHLVSPEVRLRHLSEFSDFLW